MYRDRRLLILILPAVCFLLIAASLYLGHDQLSSIAKLRIPYLNDPEPTPSETAVSLTSSAVALVATSTTSTLSSPSSPTSPSSASASASDSVSASASASTSTLDTLFSEIKNGTILSSKRISAHVEAILDPASTKLPRLECPDLNTTRYDTLRNQTGSGGDHVDYFFALNLRNCRTLLPRLLGSIVEAARFLGPNRCALSIVEGNSPDGTAEILAALEPFLEDIGLPYTFQSSKINPGKGSRIPKLAQLRNLALEPLVNSTLQASENTTVLFINDVAACPEDLLELALQRRRLGADMTCAMDWTYVGPDPTFYDVWVSRGINGDSFFEIPPNGSWDNAWNLFWNDGDTKSRLRAGLPFQVFSCWNGATAFTAAPLLREGVRFRDRVDGECGQGEPQMFCKDLWFRGYGKIAVVPSVNLEYSDKQAKKIKELKGYTSDVVRNQQEETETNSIISWKGPPPQVKCMQGWQNQFWRPWNESLVEQKGEGEDS